MPSRLHHLSVVQHNCSTSSVYMDFSLAKSMHSFALSLVFFSPLSVFPFFQYCYFVFLFFYLPQSGILHWAVGQCWINSLFLMSFRCYFFILNNCCFCNDNLLIFFNILSFILRWLLISSHLPKNGVILTGFMAIIEHL